MNRTAGIRPTNLIINANSSIAIGIEANRSGVVELTLPKSMIRGNILLEVAVTDYVLSPSYRLVVDNSTHSAIRLAVSEGVYSLGLKAPYVGPEFPTHLLMASSVCAGIVVSIFARYHK